MAKPLTMEDISCGISQIGSMGEFELVRVVELRGSKTLVDVLHRECDRTFTITYNNLTQRKTCKFCHGAKRRVDERRMQDLLAEKRPDMELVGNFTNIRETATFRHTNCGTVFDRLAFDVLYNGRQCPTCSGVTPERSNEEMVRLIESVIGYTVMGVVDDKAKPSQRRFSIRHTECGHVFEAIFHNFFNNGTRCPRCVARHTITPTISVGTERITAWLQTNGVPFEREKRFPDLRSDKGRMLRYDFAIIGLPLLIEYDGKQHFIRNKSNRLITEESLARTQLHDQLKSQYASDNGYWLLRIRFDEIDKCEESLREAIEEVRQWVLDQGSTTSREA